MASWTSGCGEAGTAPEPNRPPAASGRLPPDTLLAGESRSLDAAALFSDPDGDALVYAGSSSRPEVATIAVSGSTATVTAVAAGSTVIGITARDPQGLVAAASGRFTVEFPNRAPEVVVSPVEPVSATVGDSLRLDFAFHFQDPDGDLLIFTAEASVAGVVEFSVVGTEVRGEAATPGTTILTVTATDPAGLSATLTVDVTVVPVPNRPPRPTEMFSGLLRRGLLLNIGDTARLDLTGFFMDPDDDELFYTALVWNAAVATVTLAGDTLFLAGVGAGETALTLTATDPGQLSMSVTVPHVIVAGPAQTVFRDDFNDDTSLPAWQILDAEAEVSEGILRLTSTDTNQIGVAGHTLASPIAFWEMRVRMSRAQAEGDALAVAFMLTGDEQFPALRFDMGPALTLGEPTNYRLLVFIRDGPSGGGWYLLARGVSDAIPEGAGEFAEIAIRLTAGAPRDRMLVGFSGSEVLFEVSSLGEFPVRLTEIGLGISNPGATGATSLFDWVEVSGSSAWTTAAASSESLLSYFRELRVTPLPIH